MATVKVRFTFGSGRYENAQKKYTRKVSTFSDHMRRASATVNWRIAKFMRKQARLKVRKWSRTLHDSIDIVKHRGPRPLKERKQLIEIHATAEYAAAQEFGYTRHKLSPTALTKNKDGDAFAKWLKQKGIGSSYNGVRVSGFTPYMAPALKEAQARMLEWTKGFNIGMKKYIEQMESEYQSSGG